LGCADLEALVAKAVDENPMLERRRGRMCDTCGAIRQSGRCDCCTAATGPFEVASVIDWREELRRQGHLELPRRLHPLLDLVIGSLDDRGFLSPLLASPEPDLKIVVNTLREIGPPGIAATSATDSLRLQVAALAATGQIPVALTAVVEGWLPQVADGKFSEVAAGLGLHERQIVEAVDYLVRHTRPFVAVADSIPRTGPVDVVFTLTDDEPGQLATQVLRADDLGILLTSDFDGLDHEAHAWLAPHREAATKLLAAVNARAEMLSRVATVLASWQSLFILAGPQAHRGLRRRDIAHELQVHPSTVGRAVSGKIARCPDGRLVPLRDFFGSTHSMRRRIGDVILAHPDATDAAVAAELARLGSPIARRTVSKYRSMLRLAGGRAKPGSSTA
jgi:RNA polymerase sigma-54 factor